MLYIISTPIGNLKDITYRAIETLKNCEYILCEDTRVSKILLDRYHIKKRLFSFHKFNEKKLQSNILKDLKEEKIIALISDAGTPLISDPGESLIKACYEENIKVEAIPGPCSIIQALVLSGFKTKPFQFLGFLPKKTSELNFFIKKMLFFDGVSICFESSKRILKTLEKIASLDPKREVCILKEMTKKFEKRIANRTEDMLKHLKNHPLKGELVLVVNNGEIIDDLSIEECIKLLQSMYGLSLKEAMKVSSKIKNISKKKIYEQIMLK
ncbi:MAG: Ribosomal RNA small subunit methyltransferase I [Candidatus Anoxychlamydiales bacterium]|nr:Ribosomal RNA small subunit methyltransferase I [Candidatus Anoxychlamydiales bacterium]